ncbi:PAAR repeat-containing protein [Xenorhabdus beddingii]|uniref:PAAR repeat-containing protein n=1 Tax=Xenorhabdus beddingii TaxID=40578 RepID=A0A1Y2SIU6_9GAMM|nr:PAAR repeat-containing protein [Xenorhabdus beddingii]
MTGRAVIRLNDTTDHGGTVITAIDSYVYLNINPGICALA